MEIDLAHALQSFVASYRSDGRPTLEHGGALGPLLSTPAPRYLLDRFGGSSFEGGLYRLHAKSKVAKWTDTVVAAFPGHGRIECFASDWLGRQFALSPDHMVQGAAGVLMFEPGTGKVLTIPANFETFHTIELVDFRDAALASDAYEKWIHKRKRRPALDQCIGYAVPLFLGGADDIGNMEVCDMAVYWSLAAQLLSQLSNSPDGSGIQSVSFRPRDH